MDRLYACSNFNSLLPQNFSLKPDEGSVKTKHYYTVPPSTLISLINMETRLLIMTFFHPPRLLISLIDFFPQPLLLIYCRYVLVFFQKIPPSMFIPSSSFTNS